MERFGAELWWIAWTRTGCVMSAPRATTDATTFAARVKATLPGPYMPSTPDDRPDTIDWRLVRGDFDRAVLERCLHIRTGDVCSYGALAAETGRPGAARAVGRALAANPLPGRIPCHRVVGADGRLGRYEPGGTAMQARMLAAEGVPVRDGRVRTGAQVTRT